MPESIETAGHSFDLIHVKYETFNPFRDVQVMAYAGWFWAGDSILQRMQIRELLLHNSIFRG